MWLPDPGATSLGEVLADRSRAHGALPLFVFLADGETETERLTYGQLDRRARALAGLLREQHPLGARALLLYPPGLDFTVAFFACLYAGLQAVPVSTQRSLSRLHAVASDCDAAVVLSTERQHQAVRARLDGKAELDGRRWLNTDGLPLDTLPPAELVPTDRGQTAFLQYTSGSTANPKGVIVTHGSLLANLRAMAETMHLPVVEPGDTLRTVSWLPQHHDMGLIGHTLAFLYCGGTAWLMPPVAFVQRPWRWLQTISHVRAQASGAPNFAFDHCARRVTEAHKAELDLSCWRRIYNGAEPVRAQSLARFAEALRPCGLRAEALQPVYGLAEATLIVSVAARERPPVTWAVDRAALAERRLLPAGLGAATTLVSCGQPIPGHRVAIVDADRRVQRAEGEVGEIWFQGPSVAAGYWGREAETQETFHATLQGREGRWLRTGDLGSLVAGELYVCGRVKDLLLVDGRNVYPQDVESLCEMVSDQVRPSCLAAFALDGEDQEEVCLVAEVRRLDDAEHGPAIASALRAAVAGELGFRLAHVLLARPGEVPKTTSGKVQRQRCRRLVEQGELVPLFWG